MIAKLDAINLYEQLASISENEKIKKSSSYIAKEGKKLILGSLGFALRAR